MIEFLLVIIILLLLGVILFSGGGFVRRLWLLRDINRMHKEIQRLKEVNAALRSGLGLEPKEQEKRFGDMLELVRDLESLKGAIEGSGPRQRISKKYSAPLGPRLLESILAAYPTIDSVARWKLAHELLVGEVGRAIMRNLSGGASLEKTAGDCGIPVAVAKGRITRLQILGYLDAGLKLTELGEKALA